MIDIKKGSRVLRVSKCAYNDTFKKLGYEIVDNSVEVEKKSTSTAKINKNEKPINDEKLIKEEKEKNKEEDEVITSDDLKVNVIGENIKNFDEEKKEEQKENSLLEKVLQEKNKSKGK